MPATACGFNSRFGHALATPTFDSARSWPYGSVTCEVYTRRLRLTARPAAPVGPQVLCLSYRGRGDTHSHRGGEPLPHVCHGVHQRIDIARIVVHIETRPRRRVDAERAHERLRAMMSRANGDVLGVEQLRQIVRMHVAPRDAHQPAASLS